MSRHGFLDALLFEHPRAVGESYGAHRANAWYFPGRMLAGALAAFVHGLLPGVCTSTASRIVRELHQRLDNQQRIAR